jgi:hypothetical protein
VPDSRSRREDQIWTIRSGGPDSLWPIWNRAKRLSLFARAHLSALCALSLTAIILAREFADLKEFVRDPIVLLIPGVLLGALLIARYAWLLYVPATIAKKTHFFYALITVSTISLAITEGPRLLSLYRARPFTILMVALAVAAIFSAVWDFFGDKMSTSHRDIWFSVALREALRQLDALQVRQKTMSDAEISRWYSDFLEWVLLYSSTALGGRKSVQAAFLVKSLDREDTLRLLKTTSDSVYPRNLEVTLPTPDDRGGAAGLAFSQERPAVVYMPYRKAHNAFISFWQSDLLYNMSPYAEVVRTEDKSQPWFESSLSVPVYFYDIRTGAHRIAGVLTFSSPVPDPFEPNDFLMAECFAHLISEALLITQAIEASRSDERARRDN